MNHNTPADCPSRTVDAIGIHVFALWLNNVIGMLADRAGITTAAAAGLVAQLRLDVSTGFLHTADEIASHIAGAAA